MSYDIKVYLIIAFWLLLIYFLGVRRYSLFFQNLFNGRPIRNAIKQISQNNFKSFFSGSIISFLIQSPFGAINHIKSYTQSGLINFKQMGAFISGSQLATSLSLLLLLFVPNLPKKVIIATLLLSLFFKLFIPKFKFWLIDLLLFISVFILAISEARFANLLIYTHFSSYFTPMIIFAIGFVITLIFKSYLFSGLVFFIAMSQSVSVDKYYLYIIAIHLSFAVYFLATSLKFNTVVKRAFLIKLLATLVSGFLIYKYHIQILVLVESLLSKIVSTTIYSNSLQSGGDAFESFNQWINIKFGYSAANVVYFVCLNLFFIFSISAINMIFVLVFNNIFNKLDQNKPKQMQSLIFPGNTQFYSPYLYVDHFKQESKKMAAMLENIINIALDENSHSDTEALLRAKKYNLILERVRLETRDYSVKSLKKIRIPYTNQENLHLLQVTEVVEAISQHSLNLLNVKNKQPFTKQEKAYANKITNNYDHIFEAFMSNNISIYPSKLATIKEPSEVSKVLDEINVSVLELATILKNINKLRSKTNS